MSEDDGSMSLYAVERGLRELESSGGKAAQEVRKARIDVAQAKRKLRLARARAFVEAKQIPRTDNKPSTVQERDIFVVEKTDTEQFELDIAEATLRYACDLIDERQGERSSLQTRAKLVMEAMRLASYAGQSDPKWRQSDRAQGVIR